MSDPERLERQAQASFCDQYLADLVSLAPIEQGLTRGVRHGDVLMSPDESAEYLATTSYDRSLWEHILNARSANHSIRKDIVIALGQQIRSSHILSVNLRALDELDGYSNFMPGISERVYEKVEWHTPALQKRLANR